MGKVTQKDIVHFNELYYCYKNKAKVARETGFSASTVSRYIDPNWKPINKEIAKHFLITELPEMDENLFKNVENFGELCTYTEAEKKEIEELWEEIQ